MNAVLVAIAVMLGLSLIRCNVVIALVAGALAGGVSAGASLKESADIFARGVGGGANIALSYGLLGAFATGLAASGFPKALTNAILNIAEKTRKNKRESPEVHGGDKITRMGSKFRYLLFFAVMCLSIISQNIVPIHIAFIPLLIPPLLSVLSQECIDRRALVCIITFGITATYMIVPFGFGDIYLNQIVLGALKANGLTAINDLNLPVAMLLPILGMALGLLFALFVSYRKPRSYRLPTKTEVEEVESSFCYYKVILSISAMLLVQILAESMIMGALSGCLVLMITGAVPWREANDTFVKGIQMMAFCSTVMIAAAGFSEVIRATGAVQELVYSVSDLIGGSQAKGVFLMLLTGLFITMGVGSSFSTVPIIASIFVPLGMELQLSIPAIAVLIVVAGGLGDAGSPASESTLGPTAGLNVDGQHDHIWDSVVPTFLHFNIPLLCFGWLTVMML